MPPNYAKEDIRKMNIIYTGPSRWVNYAIRDIVTSPCWHLVPTLEANAGQCKDYTVILYPDSVYQEGDGQVPAVVCNTVGTGNPEEQLLTTACSNMVKGIREMLDTKDIKPPWLPQKVHYSVPEHLPNLANIYNEARKSSKEVIAYIATDRQATGFLRALRLLATPELTSIDHLMTGLCNIGKIDSPDNWSIAAQGLYSYGQNQMVLRRAINSSDENGKVSGISTTENESICKVVAEALGLDDCDMTKMNYLPGSPEQSRGIYEGARRARGQLIEALNVKMKDSHEIGRVGIVATESFLEDIDSILDECDIEPEFPVIGDFICCILHDSADIPYLNFTKGTPAPRRAVQFMDLVHQLLHPLQQKVTIGDVLHALFPKMPSENWHKSPFPEQDRYHDIKDCLLGDFFRTARLQLSMARAAQT